MNGVYYRSTVVRLGEEVEDMLREGVLIFFAEPLPAVLESVSIVHQPTLIQTDAVREGHLLRIGGRIVTIRAVGQLATHNLRTLGHLVVYADGATEPMLPGAIHVDSCEWSAPQPGEIIELWTGDL